MWWFGGVRQAHAVVQDMGDTRGSQQQAAVMNPPP